ncbi:MAG: zf-HC2 domain-containing protein [Candidatus Eisenbacteria bacterium]
MSDEKHPGHGHEHGHHGHDHDHDHAHGEHQHDASCRALAARLSEYLDGELPEDLVEDVDTHFQACQRCEEFVESLERVRQLGAVLPTPKPTPERRSELVESLRHRIEHEGSQRVTDPGWDEAPLEDPNGSTQ